MTDFTPDDKFRCAARELKMRKQVYPRWVQINKMTQEQADHEIAVMEAIVEDYRQKGLFD